MYSLDGLLADEGAEYWQLCFGLPVDPVDLGQKTGVYQSAYAHIMGRATYDDPSTRRVSESRGAVAAARGLAEEHGAGPCNRVSRHGMSSHDATQERALTHHASEGRGVATMSAWTSSATEHRTRIEITVQ